MIRNEKSRTCNQKQTRFGSGGKRPETRGILCGKSSSQETARILTLTNALAAATLVMDVTRSGDGTFAMRMDTAREVRRRNPEIKIALLCDNVSDESSAYKVKCAKEDGSIDAFFYESVPSDYLADAIDAL